ncbi:uncharacterized protein PG998_014123 [Apiospora kogelbergensis]|uniref:uncharacterized protein n=1 Tax=Apiospora kogelbergensis TaxID=1337665 RepID=UPI0031328F10
MTDLPLPLARGLLEASPARPEQPGHVFDGNRPFEQCGFAYYRPGGPGIRCFHGRAGSIFRCSPSGLDLPEQTRTVGEDVQLYAPKPTMPAQSAKQRVMTVTRTDSDKAASFGIGRPTVEDVYGYGKGLKKKASTTSQLSNAESHIEDEHGIPEIGQRVPMLHYAGDVQAPSPAPSVAMSEATGKPKNHSRKHSGRTGFDSVPPGSYGLHGHGVAPADKFEKAYYEKHPELHKKEIYNHLHDRAHDFSMSSEELNKIVRDTASRGAGFGTGDHISTPSEQVGHQATEEYTSRISSPRPPSAAAKHAEPLSSPLKSGFAGPEISVDDTDDDGVIHVDDHGNRKGYHKNSGESSEIGADTEEGYEAPILASDEVAKGPSPYELQPAVAPPAERRGSNYEMEQPRSRPASIYSPPPPEMHSTPLDDVEEYEPLFPEDDNGEKKSMARPDHLKESRHRFPSQDVWEDAPNSVHATAEVHTPEPAEGFRRSRAQEKASDITPREGETIAQAFARKQEELAELEDRSPDHFAQHRSRPPSWVEGQPHLNTEVQAARSKSAHRFPSRDVWEDTPDSLQFTTTVSTPQGDDKEPESPIDQQATSEKPSIPARPPKKQVSGDDKPAIPDRPKPQIPARPSKSPSGARESDSSKQKPAVPARPVGGKIAALQAGFMSDLNKRLQLGPQAPKKDEPKEEEVEEKEKAPLPDARKGRARGPQRRAPTKAKSPSPSAMPTTVDGKPVLSFSITRVLWSIDEEGTMTVDGLGQPVSTDSQSNAREEKTESQVGEEPKQSEPKKSEPQNSELINESATETTQESATEPVAESTSSSKPPGEWTETKAVAEESVPIEETKTLATNVAGESILEETVEKKPEGDQAPAVEGAKDVVS